MGSAPYIRLRLGGGGEGGHSSYLILSVVLLPSIPSESWFRCCC